MLRSPKCLGVRRGSNKEFLKSNDINEQREHTSTRCPRVKMTPTDMYANFFFIYTDRKEYKNVKWEQRLRGEQGLK